MYTLHLYFLGPSFRSTPKALDPIVKKSHAAILNWVQIFNLNKLYLNRTMVTAFMFNKTILLMGSVYAGLGVAVELVHKRILSLHFKNIGMC